MTSAGPVSPGAEVTMAKALNTGLRAAMEADDKVLIMGEDGYQVRAGSLAVTIWFRPATFTS